MFKKIQALLEGGKKAVEFVQPKIAKNLTKRREDQQKMFKTVDDVYEKKGVKKGSGAAKIKKDAAKKVSDIYDKYQKSRKNLKSGTNPFAKKSNIKKIQETFGAKKTKKRMQAKKGSPDPKKKKKFPDLNKDGKTTFADVLMGRGVINGKKKPKKKFI
tara:strand:+ start:36 stop:509 length:474 start_codon:yes stop_codon:yes gene_type:complete